MITFFDIPSQLPQNAWSPINWRIRLVLNYKHLPYKTEWIEYPNIEKFSEEHGIQPTGKKPDGSPHYTLPAIYDDKTGTYLADTIPIAQYLDKTYPDTPIVVPIESEALIYAFTETVSAKLMLVWISLLPKTTEILNPISSEYIDRTRSEYFGKPLAEITPTREAFLQNLEKIKADLGVINGWYEKNGGKDFIMGDKPTMPDFFLAASFIGMKNLFEEGDWKEICTWQGGRWAKLLDDLKEYQAIL